MKISQHVVAARRNRSICCVACGKRTAPALLKRCARLGDGWIPLMGPNDAARSALETLRSEREAAGLDWQGFGVQAQAQLAGGDPERWSKHANRWRELGCTHMAIATHNAGCADVDAHLEGMKQYFDAVAT